MRNTFIPPVLFLFILCLFSCQKENNRTQKAEELESKAMYMANYSPSLRDSLLKTARTFADDSVSFYWKLTAKAEDFIKKEKTDAAQRLLNQVYQFAKSQPSSPRNHILLANTLLDQGILATDSATKDSLLNQALSYTAGTPSLCQAAVCANAGNQYIISDNPPTLAKGIGYVQRALLIADSLHLSPRYQFHSYMDLSDAYVQAEDFVNCKKYLDKAAPFFRYMPKQMKANLMDRYSIYYDNTGDRKRSLDYAKRCVEVYQDNNEPTDSMVLYSTMMNYAFSASDEPSLRPLAKRYLEESRAYFRKANPQWYWYATTIQAYVETQLKHYPLALRLLQETNPQGNNSLGAQDKNLWHTHMSDYFEKTKNYKKALEEFIQTYKLRDTVMVEKNREDISNLELKYRTDTTLLNHRILAARQEGEIHSLQWKFITAASVGVLLMGVLLGYVSYSRHKRRLQNEKYLNSLQRLKMQDIRNCISPHLTFNVLNSEIQSDKLHGEKYTRLMNLARLLRASLEITSSISIPLAKEMDFVRTYIDLMNECGQDITLHTQTDPSISQADFHIPSMIIQIPVENAIKHGFAQMDGQTERLIDINIQSRTNGIHIAIFNNGQPYSPFLQRSQDSTGTGMKVIYQSLLLMNAKNKQKITFDISQGKENKGTCVYIFIPSQFDFEL